MSNLIFSYTLFPAIIIVIVFIKMYLIDRITCKNKTNHSWGKWLLQEDKKTQIRSCEDCGFSQKENV